MRVIETGEARYEIGADELHRLLRLPAGLRLDDAKVIERRGEGAVLVLVYHTKVPAMTQRSVDAVMDPVATEEPV